MQTKNSTKPNPKSRAELRQQSATELTAHVIAILEHPNTPRELIDGIRDALVEMENMAQILTRISEKPASIQELIEVSLGGARLNG